MTHCHLIGIGGSGAKSVEAALHLFAAGLGPDRVTVSFIDADAGNGNLIRAGETRQCYEDARRHLRNKNESALSEQCRLFKTEVSVPDSGPIWSPVPPGERRSLQELFYRNLMSADSRTLFDCLFHAGGESGSDSASEQGMSLFEGFRGRPSVGAAVIHAMAHKNNRSWKALLDALQRGKSEDVRVFLIGSIFGGTGAAGFPVIARLLRQALREAGIDRGVEIAGAMLLPYFRFPDPREQDAIGIAAKADAFIEQSRGALDYYYRLLKSEHVFDNLYMIGWPHLIQLKVSATGGKRQINPPLLPEVYAALAAARFFRKGALSTETPIFHTTCVGDLDKTPVLSWTDLPAIDPNSNNPEDSVKGSLARLLRFAVAYRNIYEPLLNLEGERTVGDQNWYQRLLTEAGVKIGGDTFQATVRTTTKYSEMLLRWAANLQAASRTDVLGVDLFDAAVFADGQTDENGMISLPDGWGPVGRRKFGEMIRDNPGTSLAAIFEALTEARLPDSAGAARFFEMLFNHCGLEPPPARRRRPRP